MSPSRPTAAQALLVLAGMLVFAACGDTAPSPSPSAASTPETGLSAIACATDDSTDVGDLTGVWQADPIGVYYIRQVGDCVWWFGTELDDIEPGVAGQPGFANVAPGRRRRLQSLVDAARGADVLVIEGISRPMVRAIQNGATAASRDRTATIMHDIQDYHIDPAEAADIANRAGVKLLAFYHLLPAPDTFLARRLFAQDVRKVRAGEWTIADDGSLYTLPAGSADVRIGRVPR